MPTSFTQVKVTDSKAFYRSGGSQLRLTRKSFPAAVAATLEITALDADGNEVPFTAGPAPRVRAEAPAEVQEAARLLKEYNDRKKAEKEAAMTPEQREKREARIAAKKAAKLEAKSAKSAKPVAVRRK